MDVDQRLIVEADIRARCAAADLDGAMTAALTAYGRELFGFLAALTRDEERADDAFGATCERLWRGLPGFRWESTFRVWAYTIARNEFLRSTRENPRRRRQVPISQARSLAAAVRSSTPPHLRTENKQRLLDLRDSLDPDDFTLLCLRLDRRLEWLEIAHVLGDGDPANAKRTAAALRKRYERLKVRLKARLLAP